MVRSFLGDNCLVQTPVPLNTELYSNKGSFWTLFASPSSLGDYILVFTSDASVSRSNITQTRWRLHHRRQVNAPSYVGCAYACVADESQSYGCFLHFVRTGRPDWPVCKWNESVLSNWEIELLATKSFQCGFVWPLSQNRLVLVADWLIRPSSSYK